MHSDVIFAGFGGQGVLLAGKILAQAGVIENKHVTFFPSYGGEMRGGTANCTVVVSDKRIDSPVTSEPGAAIIFNNPSMGRFEPAICQGGLLLVNSSMVNTTSDRSDLQADYIPANEIAHELGDERVVNMILLGSYTEKSGVVSLDSLKQALNKLMANKRSTVIEINHRAIDAGAAATKEQ